MTSPDQNPVLTSFLVGKFNRVGIRETLEGATIADISGMDMSDFLACLAEKDRLIGARLWAEVLLPVRHAWQEVKFMEPAYRTATKRLADLLAEIRARLAPPNA
jgi:hypothetical protein